MTDNDASLQLSERLLKEAGFDKSGRSMYAFYCCNLPSPQLVDYDKLLQALLCRLESIAVNEYSLVLFAGGGLHYPTWGWTLQAYSKLGRNIRKNLKALLVVHPSMWPKFLLQTMGMIVSPKFASKLIWVDNLTRLAELVPMLKLDMPAAVQEHNYKQEAPGFFSFSRRPPVKEQKKVFGEYLDVIMGVDGSNGCPQIVMDCVAYIKENGLDADGLFRKSAALKSLQEAKRLYNEGGVVDFQDLGGVHVACGLLKMWFRELPVPLVHISLYPLVCEIESATNKVHFIRTKFLPSLSISTQLVLCELFSLLNAVYLESEVNRMTSVNLTIVWSPNFVRSNNLAVDMGMCAIGVPGAGIGTIVKTCIEDYESIFGDSVALLRRSNSTFTSLSSAVVLDAIPSFPQIPEHLSEEALISKNMAEPLLDPTVEFDLHSSLESSTGSSAEFISDSDTGPQ
ncbi:hypothetical protein BASA50_010934 [Batrachochytrium salamandrivorans]|uniref:Rho-GAP domain-containing protein n=1 Tax=Batrachochytrium salamandrivorans TaxID=1357716 RepID=A0ABQ8EX43_9FUNG|nr:hypothetical protein BASA50_010934 [Batrachochytrium salamandrivorans]